jgi:ankyrin repeat protein
MTMEPDSFSMKSVQLQPLSIEQLAEAARTNFASGPWAARVAQQRLRLNSKSPWGYGRKKERGLSVSRQGRNQERRGTYRERSGSLKPRSPTSVPLVTTGPSEFFEAIAEGDIDEVIAMLERGVPPDAKDDESNTGLILAAEGEPQIVEVLLETKACDVNHQNSSGTTALMQAVRYEDEDIVNQLLAAGARLDLADENGQKVEDMATNADIRTALGFAPIFSAQAKKADAKGSGRRASVANVSKDVAGLFEAISDGDIEQVAFILEHGVPIDCRDDDDNTPLIIAAEGEPAIVELLIERGADIDLQNRNGVTALIAAVKFEDPPLVSLLINAGASLTVRDRKGRRAADFAVEVDKAVQFEMAELFGLNTKTSAAKKKGRHKRRRKSMVHISSEVRDMLNAVSESDLPKVRTLIGQGHSVNGTDDDGNTALIFAAEGEPLIVDFLITSGASIDLQNKNGLSALMVAINHEEIDVIKLLMAAGANIELTDREGGSAVDLARESGSETMLRLILGFNDDSSKQKTKTAPSLPMEVMRRGSLPSCTGVARRVRALFDAVSEGDMLRLTRLLDLGTDVDSVDDAGNTPLHFAAEGELHTVIELIKHKAEVNSQNLHGVTPLMMAIQYNDPESAETIIRAGADVTIQDKSGKDAAHYAKLSGSSRLQSMVKHGQEIDEGEED